MTKKWLIVLSVLFLLLIVSCPQADDEIFSSMKEITAFSFSTAANPVFSNEITGSVSDTGISLIVPHGTNVGSLIADFTTSGMEVWANGNPQFSGNTANDFSQPVIYTVKAEDGSTRDYTVSVTIDIESSKEITSFSFKTAANTQLSKEAVGLINGTKITVSVPVSTNVGSLVADFTTTGASVTANGNLQFSGNTANDFSNPVIYTVQAEDGSTLNYIVTVELYTPDTAKDITDFSFTSGANGQLDTDVYSSINDFDISITVPYNTDITGLVATFSMTGVSISVDGIIQTSGVTANDFTDPVLYTVEAEDGSTSDFTVTVIICPPDTSKDIINFSFLADVNIGLDSDVSGSISGTDIFVTVPYGTDVTALVANFVTTGVSVNVGSSVQTSNVSSNDYTNPITYHILAEDGSTKEYIVTVNVALNPAKDLTSFSFLASENPVLAEDVIGSICGLNIFLYIPLGVDLTALIADFTTTGTSVSIDGTVQTSGMTVNDFSNELNYTVTAENGTEKNYFIEIRVVYDDYSILTATDGQYNDQFGSFLSCSADGNTLVVGAPRDTNENGSTSGCVYVYRFNPTIDDWTENKIISSDGTDRDIYFGCSVSCSDDGNTFVVGEMGGDDNGTYSGSAYVYRFDGNDWVETKITLSDGTGGEYFGNSVSCSADGNRIFIGAPGDFNEGINTGCAYIYDYNGISWNETKITASDGESYDSFGYSVSCSSDGNTLLIGALSDADNGYNSGSAYVYRYDGSKWNETKLTASDAEGYDCFGGTVYCSGDGKTLLINSWGDADRGADSGSLYVYRYSISNWVETKIIASDLSPGDKFGTPTCSHDGNTIIAGSIGDDDMGEDSGSAYMYVYDGSDWTETKIIPSDGESGDSFGYSGACSSNGNTIFIGAAFDNGNDDLAGSVYVFSFES